ncbi:meiotic nuclear division protein 1 [Lentinus tigrinus ALCF2SS1-7]|uniref:Meiotic nuclear division protein 1 n=1 Tax=Lentinus tigrinus ALCF2SS1-6 TaxID=1328759 RepID=A0A5C2S7G1_9APHY|nr:meiotic nuclear division protein 1 [Lentinus tigrinus ALCF2SS1-6]RPD78057.1 meiotic nuclear division protein 1 [Lentinus tigrinus ALCF2SS1-7]
MAPRGLSAEEKRVKLLEIFHETKDFFQLKELEKMAPKMKGIVSQSVKEVLQSLVDDGLVQMDKIGSSNFFWSFPSQRGAIMQNRLATVREQQTTLRNQVTDLRSALEAEKASRPESDDRAQALEELSKLKKEFAQLETELAAYGACDPVKLEEKRRALFLAKEAAVRWTDNYSMLLSHFTRQNGIEASDIRTYLGIDEEYEDIDT